MDLGDSDDDGDGDDEDEDDDVSGDVESKIFDYCGKGQRKWMNHKLVAKTKIVYVSVCVCMS